MFASFEMAARYLTHAQNSLNETPVDEVGVVKYPIIISIAGMFRSYELKPLLKVLGNRGATPGPGQVALSTTTVSLRSIRVL
jgi:hypothetical protein